MLVHMPEATTKDSMICATVSTPKFPPAPNMRKALARHNRLRQLAPWNAQLGAPAQPGRITSPYALPVLKTQFASTPGPSKPLAGQHWNFFAMRKSYSR
jgi:hypothetical protein